MLFERRGRDRGASSAAAGNTKDLWRPAVGGENLLEREKRQVHFYELIKHEKQ